MPELPEVESARSVIAKSALHRRVSDVDDADTYECRPHRQGQIRRALVGRTLTDVHRRGKLMWCETSGVGRSRRAGPVLGIHLGMSGRVLVSRRSGEQDEGGDYVRPGRTATLSSARKPEWDRFTIVFADGGALRLFDKRRLGRVYLDPDVDALGPDAGEVGVREFREVVGRGTAPVKARLLDQHAIAGIGNLLADEILWQAAIDPRRRSVDLSHDELTVLHRALRRAVASAIRKGGAHTGDVIESRTPDAHCPRCGAPMKRGTVGGRTTWWCSKEQQVPDRLADDI